MAHHITKTDGLVLVGQKAWHGLGVRLPERCTAMEALKWAGMDWDIELVKPTAVLSSGVAGDAGNQRLIFRRDTGECFGSATESYAPYQNREGAELLDQVAGIAAIETAGTILGGRKAWFLLDMGSVPIAFDDHSKNYFMLSTSHDGTQPIQVGGICTRVVCANTRALALEELAGAPSVRHTRNASSRLQAIINAMMHTKKAMETYGQMAKRMAEANCDQQQLESYFSSVWQRINGKLELQATPTRRDNRFVSEVAQWVENFRNDKRQTALSTAGTVWAAHNSVTQWANHERTVRDEAIDPTRRLDSVLFGTAAKVNNAAWDAALTLVS